MWQHSSRTVLRLLNRHTPAFIPKSFSTPIRCFSQIPFSPLIAVQHSPAALSKAKVSDTKKKGKSRKSNSQPPAVLLNTNTPATIEDSTVSHEDVKYVATEAAHEGLFKGADAVEDSVLDGFYSIRNMDGFEKWISEHASTLCKASEGKDKPKDKTLVLDLDNTGSDYPIKLHPACLTFLHEMSAHYEEIAIYTSSSKDYAQQISCQIALRYAEVYRPNRFPISEILSRDDCPIDPIDKDRCKDLLRFGKLDNVVFIDDDPYYSMRSQNDNVLQVRRYHGNESEEAGLMALVPLLKFLSAVDSVPSNLRKLKKVWHKNGLVKIVQSTGNETC
ncbi:uncharacterized protein PGTG_08319 [Puccinia graminis f. sp. tritici CRL 75-36-700-3]|uniref:Mitochondrial import inner membrane translocase subunit TIM50 n=1 Tax=Puccinia graminis f. sp. tritici (strain CRL 75-36-700-3 / race SCCL) TaxID=418459 RepID=E3KE06_PUCGT|nr:uncharacterized protein PGTG_08319 [Puccinia graminis f. sp. tritici CRL 75-36-700-3]EFP82363.1 hypothetical protein PGTG_08319 [Puccinia graminis f. sp. tritici CRL 75-36-700-3]